MTAAQGSEAKNAAPAAEARRARYDLAALADRRFLAFAPLLVLGLSLPFLARAIGPLWMEGSAVAQARFLARLCIDFILLACFA
jgi:hypothetical protein